MRNTREGRPGSAAPHTTAALLTCIVRLRLPALLTAANRALLPSLSAPFRRRQTRPKRGGATRSNLQKSHGDTHPHTQQRCSALLGKPAIKHKHITSRTRSLRLPAQTDPGSTRGRRAGCQAPAEGSGHVV